MHLPMIYVNNISVYAACRSSVFRLSSLYMQLLPFQSLDYYTLYIQKKEDYGTKEERKES